MAVELTSLQRLWNMARALRPSPPRRALNAMAFCPSTARAPVCPPKQSQRVHKRRSLKLRGVRDAKAIEVVELHHAFWATGAEQSGSLTRSLSSRPSLGGLCVLPAEF